jgi:hypothetical protein
LIARNISDRKTDKEQNMMGRFNEEISNPRARR